MQPLSEAVEFIRGITFKPEQLVEPHSDDSVVCMRTKNIQRDLDESDLIAVPRALVKRDEQMLRDGDILLSSANSWELVGKSVQVTGLEYPATAGGFISIVRPRRGKIDPDFLYRWISYPATQHVVRHCGRQTTNISNLSVERFLALPMPALPLEEQKRLAAILGKADAIRRKREQAIALTEDLPLAIYDDLFGDPVTNERGWPTSRIGDETTITSGATPSKQDPSFWDGDIPWVSPKDMKRPYLEDALDHVSEAAVDKGRIQVMAPGAVLIVVRGMILVHTMPVALSRAALAINQDLKALRPSGRVLPEFLLWTLRTMSGYLLARVSTAAHGTKRLELAILRETPLILPPLDVQERFRRSIEAAGALETRMRAASNLPLFDSLSQHAFRGEL